MTLRIKRSPTGRRWVLVKNGRPVTYRYHRRWWRAALEWFGYWGFL
jgi:hypothetical protein